MKPGASPADLIPDGVWKKFSKDLKLPEASRAEVVSAIETYRAFIDDDTPTGAQQRAHFKTIQSQAADLAASLSKLTFSERWSLLEKLGVDFDEASPATLSPLVENGIRALIGRQDGLSLAARDASAGVMNSKSGDSRKKSIVDLLVHFLDDILIRHTGEPLTIANHPLTFLITVFRIADVHRNPTTERTKDVENRTWPQARPKALLSLHVENRHSGAWRSSHRIALGSRSRQM